MRGHGQKFGRRHESAIAALIACPTLAEAAQQAGVSQSTLSRWMATKEFSDQYERQRGRLVEGVSNRLRRRALGAVEILWRVANSPKSKSTARTSAARAIVEFTLRSVEQDELREIHRLVEQLDDKLAGKT